MVGVDAAVEHADEDVARAVGDLVGLVGLDHLHVPLLCLAGVRGGRGGLDAGDVAVDRLLRALLVAGGALAPRRRDVGRGALGDRDAARRADRVERVAGGRGDGGAEAARSEWATTTPICGHACTTTPPAFFTALLTTLVWPGLATLVLSR